MEVLVEKWKVLLWKNSWKHLLNNRQPGGNDDDDEDDNDDYCMCVCMCLVLICMCVNLIYQ